MINILSSVAGLLILEIMITFLVCLRSQSKLHVQILEWSDKENKKLICTVMLVTVLVCVLPMALSTIWNGQTAAHERQYEYMARAILNGNLHLDCYYVDPLLLEMENPYDAKMRAGLEVIFEWDNAFYNGKYYMYFGVVPTFLTFLPFLMLTGKNLSTFVATQIFTTFFIIGVFVMFYMLAKRFFEKISLAMYLTLAVAVSIMSIWYAVGSPVLYCTAITAGLCMEIWSLFFFIKAVWIEEQQRKTIVYAFLGSLFGALTFGCRPPIALANIVVLPMLIVYLKKRKIEYKLILQLVFAAMPYFVVGILLMTYNYLRFDNPFEFGSAYQLTLIDMQKYGSFAQGIDMKTLLNGIYNYFFEWRPLNSTFPYCTVNGVYINYPILIISIICMLSKNVRNAMKKNNLNFLVVMIFFASVIIIGADVIWSPYLVERYRMDVYWLLGILGYIAIGFYSEYVTEKNRRKFSWGISMLCGYTVLCSGLYLLEMHPGISIETFYNFFINRLL